jgi:hypothetical protein
MPAAFWEIWAATREPSNQGKGKGGPRHLRYNKCNLQYVANHVVIYTHTHIYIYIQERHRERERERERERHTYRRRKREGERE